MKRILSTLICVIILFNFIFASCSYADEVAESDDVASKFNFGDTEMTVSDDFVNEITYEGTSTDPKTGSSETYDLFSGSMGNVLGTVLGIVSMIFSIVPLTAEIVLTIITADGTDLMNSITSSTDNYLFSIEKTVFNEIGMFNIDYFDFSSESKSHNFFGLFNNNGSDDGDSVEVPNSIITIKKSVAKWFIICRLIAVASCLLVLIYVGIRMAVSTVASDKAKYKKMLVGWVEAIILLFLMQYIIQFLLALGKILVDISYVLKNALVAAGGKSFEEEIQYTIINRMLTATGSQAMLLTVMIWCLALSHFRFFLLYLKRTIIVGFLIVISPLITITYPIDKVGDNQAQAFQAWLNELLINIFVQPIHAAIYLIFAFTAGEIATYAPLMGLIFLMAIPSAEKMVRNIFDLGKSQTVDHLQNLGPKNK
jgi:hypothetical protein